jgi:hypothetical protein
MNLPTHEESHDAVLNNKATALHKFIYENEPADFESCELFRKELMAVIAEHCVIDKKIIDDAWTAATEYLMAIPSRRQFETLAEAKNAFYLNKGFIKQTTTA